MNTSQKVLVNSFIYKGTRKMLILRGRSKGQRNRQVSEMLGVVGGNAQTVAKLATLVNIHRAESIAFPGTQFAFL